MVDNTKYSCKTIFSLGCSSHPTKGDVCFGNQLQLAASLWKRSLLVRRRNFASEHLVHSSCTNEQSPRCLWVFPVRSRLFHHIPCSSVMPRVVLSGISMATGIRTSISPSAVCSLVTLTRFW